MFSSATESIIVLVIVCTILVLLLITFIAIIIYRYQQKQNAYFKSMEELKLMHESAMLESQLEIQEHTFQNISREIHDNIGQKLTLAKLYLNTFSENRDSFLLQKINDSISLIGESINDLSNISRSMSSELVLNNGLIKALEHECDQLEKSGVFRIKLSVSGNSRFLSANKELVLFRIVQESLNNIVKHAAAAFILIKLYYSDPLLYLEIIDDGKGFITGDKTRHGMGLANMAKRAQTLNGKCTINSLPGTGTRIKIEIPLI